MNETFNRIAQAGVLPIITIDEPEKARSLANAIFEGGIPCAEVTLRTARALDAIEEITRHTPQLLLGAGTVLRPEQVDSAVAAGAKYIVTPGLNFAVVRRCQEIGVPVLPGCATPTEMERALALGLEAVKLFPAQTLGGAAYIKAVCGPYSMLKFLPTGGVNGDNLKEYLALPSVLACGGSWMVKREWVDEGRFDQIAAACTHTVKQVWEVRGNEK